jgi:uncharacterized coiled-coil DUF342 family protein
VTGQERRAAVRIDLEMLLKDAQRWRDSAALLGRVKETADGLALNVRAFSSVAETATVSSKGRSIVATYRQLQEKISSLLSEGQECFNDMAKHLQTVAENVAQTEDFNRRIVQGIEKDLADDGP